MESAYQHCIDGNSKKKSLPPDLRENTVSIASTASTNFFQSNKAGAKRFRTPESLPASKRQTLNDKSAISRTFTNRTLSLGMSPVVSISIDPVYKGFWNSSTLGISTELPFYTRTDCVVSPTSYSKSVAPSMEQKSWYTTAATEIQTMTNSPMICSQSQLCSLLDTMGYERPKIQLPEKEGRVIRIRPSRAQTKRLVMWIRASNWTYNTALAFINEHGYEAIDQSILRPYCVHNEHHQSDTKFLLNTPQDIRDRAIRDLIKAYKSNFAKLKINPAHRFTIGYRNMKNRIGISLAGRNFKNNIPYANFWKTEPFNDRNERRASLSAEERRRDAPATSLGVLYLTENKKVESDFRIFRERGRWYLSFTVPAVIRSYQPAQESLVSLDPGCRQFVTAYTPTRGSFELFGTGDMDSIYRLCRRLDGLVSKIAQCGNKRRKRGLCAARDRLSQRIIDRRTEFHKQISNYLTKTYGIVLLPALPTHSLTKRTQRTITSKTARQMLTWAHYQFLQRIEFTAKRRGAIVLSPKENYTSKQCGLCGTINETLAGNQYHYCQICRRRCHRDHCGARNILLKWTSDHCPI